MQGRRGRVRRAAPPLHGSGGHGLLAGDYARSAFGLTSGGMPRIAWAATEPEQPQRVTAYIEPSMDVAGTDWDVAEAVGCGPTLIAPGFDAPTDRPERLASPGPLPRTFVAYDQRRGRARHFVLGIAEDMTYADLARFLRGYFRRAHGAPPTAAMCLDGGASTQLSYRLGGRVVSPLDTGVSVPDAVLIVPNRP
jgi:hypothetical protein